MMRSTIQVLVFLKDCTFDQPDTLAGQQWKTALCYLAGCRPSFFSLWWGRHLEDPEQVTLLIYWIADATSQRFRSIHFAPFAALLRPLLATPPSPPYVTGLSPTNICEPQNLLPAANKGRTTISKLTFNSLSADQRHGQVYEPLDNYMQELHVAENSGYNGGDISWAMDTDGSETTTLWTIVSWESVEAEQQCQKTLYTDNGLNMWEIYVKTVLDQADPVVEIHHVQWQMVSPHLTDWLKEYLPNLVSAK